MDNEFVSTVEAKDEDLEKATRRVESKSKLTRRTVVIEVADEDGLLGSAEGVPRGDVMLERGGVNLHAT